MKPEFLEMDALAFSVGLDVGTADQALKAILSKLIGEQDRALWKLLPFMYATSFICSKTWGEAQYHSTVEGLFICLFACLFVILNGFFIFV
jgi:hypothetical protein